MRSNQYFGTTTRVTNPITNRTWNLNLPDDLHITLLVCGKGGGVASKSCTSRGTIEKMPATPRWTTNDGRNPGDQRFAASVLPHERYHPEPGKKLDGNGWNLADVLRKKKTESVARDKFAKGAPGASGARGGGGRAGV